MRIPLALLLLAGCTSPRVQPPAAPVAQPPVSYPVSDPCRALSIAEDAAFAAMQVNTTSATIAAYSRAGEAFNDCIAAQ